MKATAVVLVSGWCVIVAASNAAAQEFTFTDASGRSLLLQDPNPAPFGTGTLPADGTLDPLGVLDDSGAATTAAGVPPLFMRPATTTGTADIDTTGIGTVDNFGTADDFGATANFDTADGFGTFDDTGVDAGIGATANFGTFDPGIDDTGTTDAVGAFGASDTTPGDTVFPSLMSPDTVSGTTTTGVTTGAPGGETLGPPALADTTTAPVVEPGIVQADTAEPGVDPEPSPVQDPALAGRPIEDPALALLESPDQVWVALSGTIRFTSDDSFVLDYDDGSVRVLMENWTWYEGDSRLDLVNDQVRIHAPVTSTLLEDQVADAWSFYIEGFSTYFHALDTNVFDPALTPTGPVVPSSVELKGTVTAVADDNFTIGSGDTFITVSVSALGDNPLDDQGFPRIRQDDLVVVNAPLDSNFFRQRWVEANDVSVMRRDETRRIIDLTDEIL